MATPKKPSPKNKYIALAYTGVHPKLQDSQEEAIRVSNIQNGEIIVLQVVSHKRVIKPLPVLEEVGKAEWA